MIKTSCREASSANFSEAPHNIADRGLRIKRATEQKQILDLLRCKIRSNCSFTSPRAVYDHNVKKLYSWEYPFGCVKLQ